MAKKLKLMSLFQELQGRAQVTNRRPVSASTGIYLMQLRAQTGATSLPRRRFMISVDLQPSQTMPHPVKISHVRPFGADAPTETGGQMRPSPREEQLALPQVGPVIG